MSAPRARTRAGRPRRVLILLENLPVERDPRVRRECEALLEAGYDVSVICPRAAPGTSMPPSLAAVTVRSFRPPPEARSWLGFVWEYAYSWLAITLLTVRALLREGFDAVQACNPPDIFFPLAWPLKALGKPFVFDHHDLTPEVFTARYGRSRGMVVRTLLALERATFAAADHVISTNESFRAVALGRGRKSADDVTVVRNGPVLANATPQPPRPELREGRAHLCCWLGTMFVDDGVELALRAVAHLVHQIGRRDCQFTFLGDGQKRPDVEALARELGITEWVAFPGWVALDDAYAYLATADLGLSPNPKSPRLDVSTSMKVMEYMAFELPVVAFDVDETRRSAADAAVYATGNDVAAYAGQIDELLDDPERRAVMGKQGRARIEGGLAWDHQRAAYVGVYDHLLGGPR